MLMLERYFAHSPKRQRTCQHSITLKSINIRYKHFGADSRVSSFALFPPTGVYVTKVVCGEKKKRSGTTKACATCISASTYRRWSASRARTRFRDMTSPSCSSARSARSSARALQNVLAYLANFSKKFQYLGRICVIPLSLRGYLRLF